MYTKKSKKGFTITELIIVIVVIAILAAVLVPTFINLVDKANMSADEQAVRQMNTILAAEEVTDKPATVTEAKDILIANGIKDFNPTFAKNTYYWVGSENRVLLWTEEEVEEGEDPVGAVTYPKEMVKKYKDLTEPSVDWADLSLDYQVENVVAQEGETIEEALLEAIDNASIDQNAYLALPKNSTITLGKAELAEFCQALKSDAGVGKNVHIDLNGSTLDADNPDAESNAFYIPDGATLEFADGKMDVTASRDNSGGFQVNVGSSLVLRDIELTGDAKAMIFPSSEASEVIIDDCDIQVKSGWILMTNGLSSKDVRIVIKDAYLKNTDLECDYVGFGVMVNCTSNVHIENSTVSSYIAPLAVRAGHAEVINSTLEAYGTEAGIYKYDSFAHFPKRPKQNGVYIGTQNIYAWSEANAIPGAVLVAGDYARETESYPGDVDVSLENVTFKSANTSEIPHCVVAAKMTKNVVVDYDANTNMDEPILYNYMIPEYFGSIKINGVNKTLD